MPCRSPVLAAAEFNKTTQLPFPVPRSPLLHKNVFCTPRVLKTIRPPRAAEVWLPPVSGRRDQLVLCFSTHQHQRTPHVRGFGWIGTAVGPRVSHPWIVSRLGSTVLAWHTAKRAAPLPHNSPGILPHFEANSMRESAVTGFGDTAGATDSGFLVLLSTGFIYSCAQTSGTATNNQTLRVKAPLFLH